MADQPTTQRRADKSNETTATSLTAAGCAAFLLWIFGMIDAGKFFVPPIETAMFMGAAIVPIGSAIGKRWINEITHTGGINGKAPDSPEIGGGSEPAGDFTP